MSVEEKIIPAIPDFPKTRNYKLKIINTRNRHNKDKFKKDMRNES